MRFNEGDSENQMNGSPITPDRASSPSYSSEESEDKFESLETNVISRLKTLTFQNIKAKFMAKIFTSKLAQKALSFWVPELDVIAVTEIIEKPHFMEPLEAFLKKNFSDLVNKGLARDNPKGAQTIDENFADIYKKYTKEKKSIEQMLSELKGLYGSPSNQPCSLNSDGMMAVSSSADVYSKAFKSEPNVIVDKPSPVVVSRDLVLDVKELDSPASKFLPHGPVMQKVPFKVG